MGLADMGRTRSACGSGNHICLDDHPAALDLDLADVTLQLNLGILGPGTGGAGQHLRREAGFKGGECVLKPWERLVAVGQMRNKTAFTGTRDKTRGSLANLPHNSTDRVGDIGVIGKDHLGAEEDADRTVV